MGGVRVNLQAQVLSTDDQPIDGLYAVGEASGFAGINGNAGLEGTFLGPSIVTGRVAGRSIGQQLNAAENIRGGQIYSPSDSIHLNAQTSGNCLDCHQLATQIKQNYPGYEHYGFVHDRVLDRGLPCQGCHMEMFPYNASTHRLEAFSLTNSCVVCHGAGL